MLSTLRQTVNDLKYSESGRRILVALYEMAATYTPCDFDQLNIGLEAMNALSFNDPRLMDSFHTLATTKHLLEGWRIKEWTDEEAARLDKEINERPGHAL